MSGTGNDLTAGERSCGDCGGAIPEGSPNQLCPTCLYRLAQTEIGEGGADAAYDQIGRSIGNYEIRERIGQGGMGVVFRARQVDLGRNVALKMIRSGPFASEA